VDVRAYPGSARWPQFNREALAPALQEHGMQYRHEPALGGRRLGLGLASPNDAWQEPAFQNYADHALTPSFHQAIQRLIDAGADGPVAIMCAEAHWQHCHRRIIADYLLTAGVPVCHLMADGKRADASLTPGAEPRPDGTIVYPAAQARLL
jgi:uncharacterized protein (DUF488 family)